MHLNKFVTKILEMMQEQPDSIGWSKDGSQLQIWNEEFFIEHVHPKYFKSTNYESFLRQLNMYEFKKMSKRKNSVSFRHLIFMKGNQVNFPQIKRRKQPKTTAQQNGAFAGNQNSSASIQTIYYDRIKQNHLILAINSLQKYNNPEIIQKSREIQSLLLEFVQSIGASHQNSSTPQKEREKTMEDLSQPEDSSRKIQQIDQKFHLKIFPSQLDFEEDIFNNIYSCDFQE